MIQLFPKATASELHHMLDLPQPSVRRCLAELKKDGLYKIEKE